MEVGMFGGNFAVNNKHDREMVPGVVETVKQQKGQLEAILENISEAVVVVDKHGNYTMLNRAAMEIFVNKPANNRECYEQFEFYDMNGQRMGYEELPSSRILKNESFIDKRFVLRTKDKEIYLSVNGSPTLNINGEFVSGVVCFRNITSHVSCERMLKMHSVCQHKIMDSLELPILRLSYPDLRITQMNKKAVSEIAQILGHKVEIDNAEALKYLLELYDTEENRSYFKRMYAEKDIVYRNNFCINKNGKAAFYNFIYQPLLDAERNISEIIILGIDVTHEVEEKNLLQKEMHMRNDFFSFISHEFKTPLTVINAAVQALEIICGGELTDKSKGFIGRIKQNSLRQLRLVNNLMDIMKAGSGYLKVKENNVDIIMLTKAIIQSVMLYAEEKGVKVAFSSMVSGRQVSIDDEKYERILLNLLSNAIKFTPTGKSIAVEFSVEKGMLCVIVRDEGVGIPEEKQSMIFDMFGQVDSGLTRKTEGTGIGLALVKQLVNSMGGEIRVESKERAGSTFTVMLPEHEPSNEPAGEFSMLSKDSRLIQTAAIEFSNIYL